MSPNVCSVQITDGFPVGNVSERGVGKRNFWQAWILGGQFCSYANKDSWTERSARIWQKKKSIFPHPRDLGWIDKPEQDAVNLKP